MRWSVLAVAAVLALPTAAVAQPGMTPLQPPGATEPAPPPPESAATGDTKSENVALALSLGGTLASYGLFYLAVEREDDGNSDAYPALAMTASFGATFAPGFGHWYAGKFWTRGLGARLAASGVSLIALTWALSECPLFSDEEDCGDTTGAGVLMVGAIGLWVYGTVDDIVTAPGRVRDYNKRHATPIAITPILRHDGGGIGLSGTF